jgi:hypothetical protein
VFEDRYWTDYFRDFPVFPVASNRCDWSRLGHVFRCPDPSSAAGSAGALAALVAATGAFCDGFDAEVLTGEQAVRWSGSWAG